MRRRKVAGQLAPGEVKLSDAVSLGPIDPNAGTGDAGQSVPPFVEPAGLAPEKAKEYQQELELKDLSSREQHQIYTFFAVYFVMTGLHGLHVLIGMGIITWVLLRSLGPKNVAWCLPLVPASIGVFLAVVGIIIGHSVEQN